ncbi:unnamed protein product [Calypogeia fissa]
MAMHHGPNEIKTGGPSPQTKANIFKYFTWQWVQPLINLANKRTIQMEDLYDLLPRETTAHCERVWNECWERQMKKNGKPQSVWKLIFVSAGREMIFSFIAIPIWLVAVCSQVYVLKEIVLVATHRDEHLPWWRGFILVFGMLITSNFQSLSLHYSIAAGQRAAMKTKNGLSMAVFNKLMSLKLVALTGTSSGVMLNLIMNDTQKLLDAGQYVAFTAWSIVSCLTVAVLAIIEVRVAALPGLLVMVMAQTAQISLARGVGSMRKKSVKLTDARVRTIQEILSGIRVVKYNGWTTAFLARIEELRSMEMKWIRKGAYMRASGSTVRDGVAPFAALLTFATYVAIYGGNLSAATAFTILGLYGVLVRVFAISPMGMISIWETKIALQRLKHLLNLPDGNGSSSKEQMKQIHKAYPEASVAILDATFSWYLEHGDHAEATAHVAGRAKASKPNEKNEKMLPTLKGINMAIPTGQLAAVIGPVGSGKSSLLHAIIGEMELVKGGFAMNGTVSYAPQQPWILNDTIKNNILFASEYDEDRYRRTVSACAFEHDINTMPAREDTEIGERGINLSGGQKARLSLARACYSSSNVVLLDDPLAAVDVPTARHLMDHVLNGLLRGRTVLLVTHNKSALELCDKVFFMENGELREAGPEEEVIQKILLVGNQDQESDKNFSDSEARMPPSSVEESSKAPAGMENVETSRKTTDSPQSSWSSPVRDQMINVAETSKEKGSLFSLDPSVKTIQSSSLEEEAKKKHIASKKFLTPKCEVSGSDTKKPTEPAQAYGGLTVEEDRVVGEVTSRTFLEYCKGSGLYLWAIVLFLMGFGQAVRVLVDVWVSIWVSNKYHLSTNMYLEIYGVWIGGMLVLALSRGLLFTEAVIQAAKEMHRSMAESVLRSPQLFFDQNPVGRIMNRFSKDQSMVDELLPFTAQGMLENLVAVGGSMVLIAVMIPWFLLILPPFVISLWYCQRRYVAASRELRRLDGLSRSPIYAHFAQNLQGVTSVRAYGVEKAMHDHFVELIDTNNHAWIMFAHTSRWLAIRLDFVAACCVTTATFLSIILRHKLNAGYIGVVLIQALQLAGFFQYGMRLAADTENIFTSVERNQAYSRLPSEANPHSPSGLISEEWPQKGQIEFVDYTMAYRVDLPPVLNNLTFTVQPQEKVGILGRTGVGKSSLAAALFRMVENSACSGSILIDGIDVKLVGLDDLRLRLSIIPQDPVLFRGTVRLNLDPFHQHTDTEIHEALNKVELTKKVRSLDAGLDSIVTENGENFSVGQRQLLCLARSLLRKSKIIVMDEATAAVDGETDQLIQKTMKTVFNDCTVLTIAHRIDTVIDCDRVLVLAKGGQIAEFDSPLILLRKAEQVNQSGTTTTHTQHVFANMVFQAGPTAAKKLREAAEVAEMRRQKSRDHHY